MPLRWRFQNSSGAAQSVSACPALALIVANGPRRGEAAWEGILLVNVLNSKGIRVGEVRGAAIFDIAGQKIYAVKGLNIYRLTGELVGHLPSGSGPETRLHRSADKLFPVTRKAPTP
jgi:hypothetical protein